MHSVRPYIMILLAGLLLLVAFGCSDDEDDNGTGPDIQPFTPAELVGTWEWDHITQDGVYRDNYADYSFTDTSTGQELQFFAGGTYEMREYYNGTGPVYTRRGICYDDDSLYTKTTHINGTPVEDEWVGSDWTVASPVLYLLDRVVIPGTDTIEVVSTYIKQ